MALIDDFSKEPRYNIKAVAQKTEIQPVTIRAWERRYGLLTPERAANGYRLYSDRDIVILQWIKSRIEDGISISSAAGEFQQLSRLGQSPEAVVSDKGPVPASRTEKAPPADAIRMMLQPLLRHDEQVAALVFSDLLGTFHLDDLFEQVISPVLVDIGERWARGEINVATEHFASKFLLGKLQSIFYALPAHASAPRVMVGCAPEELHEIGPLMFSILLRDAGFRVEFLGPDLPLDDLAEYISIEKPKMLILAATLESSARELAGFPASLRYIQPAPIFGFGGTAFHGRQDLTNDIEGTYLGDTLKQSTETIKRLVGLKTPKLAGT